MEYVNRPSEHDGPECIEPYVERDDNPAQGELFGSLSRSLPHHAPNDATRVSMLL